MVPSKTTICQLHFPLLPQNDEAIIERFQSEFRTFFEASQKSSIEFFKDFFFSQQNISHSVSKNLYDIHLHKFEFSNSDQ